MKVDLERPGHVVSWRVVAASVRGTSHIKSDLPCQDALRWQTARGGWLLAALADGAGSAALAEVGAGIAADRGIEALKAQVKSKSHAAADEEWRAGLVAALTSARAAVLAAAQERKVEARELASTLTLLAVSPGIAVAAQIGDGAALASAPSEALACLTRPMVAEYLNETTFLISDTALESAQTVVRRGAWRRAGLLCDGLQLLALRLPEGTPHARFFEPLFRHLERATDLAAAARELRAFLESPRVRERTDDDLSLLLAFHGKPPVPCGTALGT